MKPSLPVACLIACLPLVASASAFSSAPTNVRVGAHDFDFLHGRWTVHNRRLTKRLAGAHTWVAFDAQNDVAALPGGLGNEEHYRTEFWPDYHAIGLNFYEAESHRWTLYWMDNRNAPGTLQLPVHGHFEGDTGTFFGDDTFAGRPIRVRHRWTRVDRDHVRWEQAFSADAGASWETNWTMDFVRR